MSRFEVHRSEGIPSGGLYELEIQTSFTIFDTKTGESIHVGTSFFEASLSTSTGGWDDGCSSGIKSIEISADERYAVIHDHDGTTRQIELPH